MAAPAPRRSNAAVRVAGSRRGQILVGLLLMMALLVGLVFYVYNVGTVVSDRVELSNAVDAAAIAAGNWQARCLNTVAMNNVGQSRMIALSAAMDGLPLAAEISREELAAFSQSLEAQADHLAGVSGRERELLEEALGSLRREVASQQRILEPVFEIYRDDDIASQTFWQVRGDAGPAPHGSFWQTAAAMDEASQGVISAMAATIQQACREAGESNGAASAFCLPIAPRLPAIRTGFADFEPVLRGRLELREDRQLLRTRGGPGGGIPDLSYPYRLGPWMQLFGHRDPLLRADRWEDLPPRYRNVSGGSRPGDSRGGGDILPEFRTRRVSAWEQIGWRAYGPLEWALRRVFRETTGYEGDRYLGFTDFARYLRQQAEIKLEYFFGDDTLRGIHRPEWIRDREEIFSPDLSIHQTVYFRVDVRSSVPQDSPAFLSPGTFVSNASAPGALWMPGDGSIPGGETVCDFITRTQWSCETLEDLAIGLPALDEDGDGNDDWQRVYFVHWYIWGAADVSEEDVEIRNPLAGAAEADLPAPVLLDASTAEYGARADEDDRLRRFSLLAIASAGDRAPAWPQRFRRDDPSGGMRTLAQVKVFNPSSWDLWTQDWQCQLAPVGPMDYWLGVLAAAESCDCGLGPWTEELDAARRQLQALGRDFLEQEIQR